MGETMETENAAFWLPAHFLTDDDFLPVGDDPLHRRFNNDTAPNFDLFSTEFDPFTPPSALPSPVSSPETDKDNDNDDNEFLAELTRHLAHSSLQETNNLAQKSWAMSTSPQSTLSGFGSMTNRSGFSSNGSPNGPSQDPSPPLTPPGAKNDVAWELLYEAATQVARLKVNAMAAQLSQHQNRGFLGATRNPRLSSKSRHHINALYDYPIANQLLQVKRQGSAMWGQGRREREELYFQHNPQRLSCGGGNGGSSGLPQSAWLSLRAGQPHPPPHHHHRQQSDIRGPGVRPVFLGGSGSGSGALPAVKKHSTGTGVFIPRRFGAQPEPRKKPTRCPSVTLPAGVVQALNLDLELMNNGVNLKAPSRFTSGFSTNHDAEILLARGNALLSQQRRSSRPEMPATMVGHDVCLPSDWTY